MHPDRVSPSAIRIAAALLLDRNGRTLLVRKQGTQAFMQPGGKIERQETPFAALGRELKEELGIALGETLSVYLGRFVAPAANETGCFVDAELFQVAFAGAVTPAAEIEEVAWIDRGTAFVRPLAPLTRERVLPLYQALSAHG